MNKKYPFHFSSGNDDYVVTAHLTDDGLYEEYFPFFERHDYYGNGYCWEGHIIQILEKEDEELLDHIEFDPEGSMFVAYFDSKEAQMRFLNLMCPIFNDLDRLGTYVSAADKERIEQD